jgi:hypothetical protein
MGPAFVAAIGYIDPGNFATNIQAGASFGYQLLWVTLRAARLLLFSTRLLVIFCLWKYSLCYVSCYQKDFLTPFSISGQQLFPPITAIIISIINELDNHSHFDKRASENPIAPNIKSSTRMQLLKPLRNITKVDV